MRVGSIVRVDSYFGIGATSASCQEEWGVEKRVRRPAFIIIIIILR